MFNKPLFAGGNGCDEKVVPDTPSQHSLPTDVAGATPDHLLEGLSWGCSRTSHFPTSSDQLSISSHIFYSSRTAV